MMFPRRIAAVSYLNTVPFIYGIEHAGLLHAGLVLSPPSRCVTSYTDKQADIALIPVGALPEIKDGNLVTSYCIGASKPVRTVVIMSDVPVRSVERLYLDSHSRTSVLLAGILCREYWDISPELIPLDDYTLIENRTSGDAFLLIGDKVFDYEPSFVHSYDLAESWRDMTGLPFVFAVWVAREGVEKETLEALDHSLAYGVEHIREAISYYGHSGKPYAYRYLTGNIDYILDDSKLEALDLFRRMQTPYYRMLNPG